MASRPVTPTAGDRSTGRNGQTDTPAHHRPWTRVGTVAAASHVFYELAAGVALPFASRIGPGPAVMLFGAGSAVAFREAGRQPRSQDAAFALLNGMYLSAVLAHVLGWPRTTRHGLPWLLECEGLRGRLMTPYNIILYVSAIAGIGGLIENRRGRIPTAAAIAVVVPWLISEQHREFVRLQEQAHRHPRWWNRRL